MAFFIVRLKVEFGDYILDDLRGVVELKWFRKCFVSDPEPFEPLANNVVREYYKGKSRKGSEA